MYHTKRLVSSFLWHFSIFIGGTLVGLWLKVLPKSCIDTEKQIRFLKSDGFEEGVQSVIEKRQFWIPFTLKPSRYAESVKDECNDQLWRYQLVDKTLFVTS